MREQQEVGREETENGLQWWNNIMFADEKFVMLAILVLPIAAGIICWFVVVLEAPTRTQDGLHTAPPANVSHDTLGVLSIADVYDPDRSVLWENQVSALQRISASITIRELSALWGCYLRLYPELYEKTSFCAWLAFLQNCNLVESDGNVVRLSANGRDFLNLLARNSDIVRSNRVVR